MNNGAGRRVKIGCWGPEAKKWSTQITMDRVSLIFFFYLSFIIGLLNLIDSNVYGKLIFFSRRFL